MIKECLKIAYAKVDSHPCKYRHYSFVIQKNEIISVGSNVHVAHATIYPLKTLHAEWTAFQRAKRRLYRPWYMINIRIGKYMDLRLSKPCKICSSYLHHVGCSKVLYSTNEGDFSV